MKEEYQKSSGAWIPAFILCDNELSPTDKIIYAMIQNLSNERGYCWASNEYFSTETGISVSTITRCVNNLKKKNLIIDFYEVNDKGRFRRLKIDHAISAPDKEGGLLNLTKGVSSNCLGGSPQIEEHNIKNINKRKEYIVNTCKAVLTSYNSICKKYDSKCLGSKLTNARISLIKNRLEEFNKIYAGRDFLKAIEFTFEYKAKEWHNDPVMWKYFELQTLLSQKHFMNYIEQSIKNKGVPPKLPTRGQKQEEKIVAKSPFKDFDNKPE